MSYNPLSANLTKWSDTLKQFVGNLPKNCLSMSYHFVGLALKGLMEGLIEENIVIELDQIVVEICLILLLYGKQDHC